MSTMKRTVNTSGLFGRFANPARLVRWRGRRQRSGVAQNDLPPTSAFTTIITAGNQLRSKWLTSGA